MQDSAIGDRPRVVVAGLGDSGVLTALRLARHADVVGISAKPGLVSGQELGIRLSRPQDWARDYWLPFDRLRALDGVRTVHGSLTGVDLDARKVLVSTDDEVTTSEPYDVLVIATGVSNGFWRRPALQTADEVRADLLDRHRRLAAAQSIAVLGGGAAAVSSAANLARVWPDKQISLYFPADRALTGHHPRVWQRISRTLADAGVRLHPGHRAVLPDGFGGDDITDGPVHFSTGQPAATADAVLWA
ncbi:FAD-dependent oxidoreductase, partial [Mycolicibacterium flavescens]